MPDRIAAEPFDPGSLLNETCESRKEVVSRHRVEEARKDDLRTAAAAAASTLSN